MNQSLKHTRVLFLAPWQPLSNCLHRWILTLRKWELQVLAVYVIVGLKEVARLKGHWLIQFSQRKYFEELMEEIQADSQSCSCQALLKEMHWKISIKARKGYLKSEMITERKGGEIAGHHLVSLRRNLVWTDGFLPRQVSPIPYSK